MMNKISLICLWILIIQRINCSQIKEKAADLCSEIKKATVESAEAIAEKTKQAYETSKEKSCEILEAIKENAARDKVIADQKLAQAKEKFINAKDAVLDKTEKVIHSLKSG
jgi:hypothetical protein